MPLGHGRGLTPAWSAKEGRAAAGQPKFTTSVANPVAACDLRRTGHGSKRHVRGLTPPLWTSSAPRAVWAKAGV